VKGDCSILIVGNSSKLDCPNPKKHPQNSKNTPPPHKTQNQKKPHPTPPKTQPPQLTPPPKKTPTRTSLLRTKRSTAAFNGARLVLQFRLYQKRKSGGQAREKATALQLFPSSRGLGKGNASHFKNATSLRPVSWGSNSSRNGTVITEENSKHPSSKTAGEKERNEIRETNL